MATIITENGQFIKIAYADKTVYSNKTGLNITSNGDTVFIEEAGRGQHSFLYTEVSSPVSTSAADLAEQINLML